MDASYRVSMLAPTPEQVFGGWPTSGIVTAIGRKYAELLAEVFDVIPRYIEGIDKRTPTLLNALIASLQNTADNWRKNATPNEILLGDLITNLRQFINHPNKTALLYPQIVERKSRPDDAKEQEELKQKNDEVKEITRSLEIKYILPLLDNLGKYQNSSLQSPEAADFVLRSMGALKQALEQIVEEQRSLLEKVIHTAKKVALEAIQDGVDLFKSASVDKEVAHNHPLIGLLKILGKYRGLKIYIPRDCKKEIENGINLLQSTCPEFKDLQVNSENIFEVYSQVTRFIQENVYNNLSKTDQSELHAQIVRFVKMYQGPLIAAEIKKMKDGLCNLLDEKGLLVEDESKKIDDSLMPDAMRRAKGQLTKAEEKKLLWDAAAADMKVTEAGLSDELEIKIKEIEDNPFWRILEDDPNLIKGFFYNTEKDVPKDPLTPISRNEILWKAMAYFLQKREWEAIDLTIPSDPKNLMKAFEKAGAFIDQFETIADGLSKEEQTSCIEKSIKHLVGCLDFAKSCMMEKEQNSWEKTYIEKAFDQAICKIRKEDIKSGIKEIQDFIRGSNYWRRLWQQASSPLAPLEKSFDEFYKTPLTPKPPKFAAEVHQLLHHNLDTKWDASFLTQANSCIKEQVIENALGLICFEYVAFFLGLNGDKTTWYKKVVETVDKIVALQERSDDSLKGFLSTFIGSTPKKETQYLEVLKTGGRKQILLELLNILIHEKGSSSSSATWAAWSSFSLFYDLVELFIRPFSEQFFSELDKLLKNASGTLNQNHLVPIKAVTKGLATYQLAMEYWAQHPITGTKDDLAEILKNSKYYEGMTPSEITAGMGYRVINQIKFPDYTGKVYHLMEKVKEFVLTPRTQCRPLDVMIYTAQGIVAAPAYVTLLFTSYIVRVITHLSNIMLQMTGKLYLWKTNFALQALDQALGAVFTDVESAPILDTLLLDQLQELAKELEKGTPPDHSEADAGDEVSKKVISEAIQYLFEVIEEDQFESLEAFRDRSRKGVVKRTKGVVYEQLKKLFATVLVSTSKSLLQKEQVEALLFELFKISKESLQGGKGVILTQEQNKALQEKLGHAPTEDEVGQEGKRISLENLKKIPDVLTRIRNLAINPTIDDAIDKATQTSSQTLLDYISWIQTRLVVKNSRNVVQFLREKLGAYSSERQSDILREIHFKYGQFIQEMRELQISLDNNASPHSPELNDRISYFLAPNLKQLTERLTAFIQNPNNEEVLQECMHALEKLEEIQVKLHIELSKLEESEKNRVIGMQVGVQGIVNTNMVDMISRLKEGAKNIAHTAVQVEIKNKVEQLQNINKNKIVVKHLLLWQMRLFLNPELAFKV